MYLALITQTLAHACACSTARGLFQRLKKRVWADTGRPAQKPLYPETFNKQQDIIKHRVQWWEPYRVAGAQPNLADVADACDGDVKTVLQGMCLLKHATGKGE